MNKAVLKTTPVLKLNVYNAHNVDDVARNSAIIISDPVVAAQVVDQDRKSNSHKKLFELQAEPESSTNTLAFQSGSINMTTRSARILKHVKFDKPPEDEEQKIV